VDETKMLRVHFQGGQNGPRYGNNEISTTKELCTVGQTGFNGQNGPRYGNNDISKTKELCTVVQPGFNVESLDQIRIRDVSWIRLLVDLKFGKSQGLLQVAEAGPLRGRNYEQVKEITPASCELIQMIELKVCRLLLPVSKVSFCANQGCTFSSLVTC
jgi:ribosomal protein L37AE/L43A